jgi:mRNA-degrading endonuclease YafQ of YafQ-DinJ toxin-antitoxin module
VKRKLLRTNAFVRAIRRFLKKVKGVADAVEAALTILSENAFDPRFKTHKLNGSLDGVWACSAGYDVRILFEFVQFFLLSARR